MLFANIHQLLLNQTAYKVARCVNTSNKLWYNLTKLNIHISIFLLIRIIIMVSVMPSM